MHINWHRDQSAFAVDGIEGERIRVSGKWRTSSFWVHQGALNNWRPKRLEDIDADDLNVLLARDQEVLLLGTGGKLRFLGPALRAHVLARGIGLECMSNDAAARTYNVLLGEGRAVLAAFLINEAESQMPA